MGRPPDHALGFFCGFAAKPSVFTAGGVQFPRNVVVFYEHLRDTHAYAAYAIVPPQIDRSCASFSALAKGMNEMTGNDATPSVLAMMGAPASHAAIVGGTPRSRETLATNDEEGLLWLSQTALSSVMALQTEINPKMIDIVGELTGAAMITLPCVLQRENEHVPLLRRRTRRISLRQRLESSAACGLIIEGRRCVGPGRSRRRWVCGIMFPPG